MKFYIAAPFFNKEQIEIVEGVKEMLSDKGIEYFSPKDDCLFENDKGMDSSKVFKTNCDQIKACDGILVITDGKDVGTIWEAGFAYGIGKENVIYAWINYDVDANFNLMLAHSANITAKGFDDLSCVLDETVKIGFVPTRKYMGFME